MSSPSAAPPAEDAPAAFRDGEKMMLGSEIEKKMELRPLWGRDHFLGLSETGEELEVLLADDPG